MYVFMFAIMFLSLVVSVSFANQVVKFITKPAADTDKTGIHFLVIAVLLAVAGALVGTLESPDHVVRVSDAVMVLEQLVRLLLSLILSVLAIGFGVSGSARAFYGWGGRSSMPADKN